MRFHVAPEVVHARVQTSIANLRRAVMLGARQSQEDPIPDSEFVRVRL